MTGLQLQESGSTAEQWESAVVSTTADVVSCCDQFVADQSRRGMAEAEVRAQEADLFRRLKAKLPPRMEKPRLVVRSATKATNHQPASDNEGRLTVVLKACPDKARLAGRLSRVLRRGTTATRMAVDMAPCVILYKSKADAAQLAIAVFEDEGSAYAVVAGDFEVNATVNQLIEGYDNLERDVQSLFAATPPALWLGEDIRAIITDVELEHEQGLLIVTGGNLCFLSGPIKDGRAQWLVIPYSRIAEVVDHPDSSGGMLEVIYREFGREDLFRFSDEGSFQQAFGEISRAIN